MSSWRVIQSYYLIHDCWFETKYVVKALPEKKLDGEWLKSELLNCLNTSHKNEFNIRGVVCK